MPSSPCKYSLAKGYASTSAKDSARSTTPDENNGFIYHTGPSNYNTGAINYNAGPFNYNTDAINYNAGPVAQNTGAMNG
jgi:hypothetical protein